MVPSEVDMDIEKRRSITIKVAIAAVIVLILGAVIYFFATMISRSGKTKVNVLYAPYAATVKFDNKTVKNHAENWIAPGKYHVTVSFENFATLEEDVVVPNESTTIYGQLSPANEAGVQYRLEHDREFMSLSGPSSEAVGDYGEKLYARFPIMKKLPVKDPHFAITYILNEDDTELKIAIRSSLEYRGIAIYRMNDVLTAEDIEKYDVEIEDIETPFTKDFVANNEKDPLKYLQKGYGRAMDGFFLGDGRSEGGYYYGFIRRNIGYIADVYRFILKRQENGTWSLCGKPYPVLTSINTNGAPTDLLVKANADKYR